METLDYRKRLIFVFESLRSNNDEQAVDAIFKYCLEQAKTNNHWTIQYLINNIDVEEYSDTIILAPLAITVSFASKVPDRKNYFDRVAGILIRRKRTNVLELLSGLD